jgi:hypothetical protein
MHRALAHYIQEQNGQHTHYWVLLLVYVGLGQHTLLGIAVGLCGALGNTLYWVLRNR